MGDLIIKPASSGSLKIQDQAGTDKFVINNSGITSTLPSGMVLEQFLLPCTGQSITVQSGTYTSQNVTTTQDSGHSSWDDVTGSTITYTPPTGTQLVIYKFCLQVGYGDGHIKLGFKFLLGGAEADKFATHVQTENYYNNRNVFEFPLLIGGSADATIGRQATWTTGVEMKLQMKSMSGNDATLHQMDNYDNSSTDVFVPPIIGITAIA